MKFWKVFTALLLILAATLLILDALGVITPIVSVIGEVTLFELIAGLLLVSLIVERLIRGRIPSVIWLLAFLFMLFEENIAYLCHLEDKNIINNWLVLLIALLLSTAFSILFSSAKKSFKCKKRKRKYGVTLECSDDGVESSLGASSIYVDCTAFTPSSIENNLGSCSVYFENVEKYEGDKTLYIENNLGSMCINVPSDWIVKTSIENNIGGSSIQPKESPTDCGPVLYIKGENNIGALSIRFV